MTKRKAVLLAFGAALLVSAAPGALDQSLAQSQFDPWGKPADLKPLLPPIIPPLLPPNASITAGPPAGPQVQTPLFDPTRDQAAPGFRLTIPTR
jgi:hypothetical protein